jgi:cobalt/nickel transport system permease protein
MHIPDGYLSPSTCLALYSAATPIWLVALRKIKKSIHTRLIPRLALFAAFSFVLMMFNVPLPGGTSGHATGAGLAAIILGPWAGMIAVSTALLIQALFFGDGGVTAFGANAFNMAIVGCLVASTVYRALTSVSSPTPARRFTAAAISSYIAINVSALLTAIEFGVQPLLFKDAAGNPLYAPFPLGVAVPAMMLGHLTVAGLAEAFVTAGVVAYLHRTSPAIFTAAPATWSRTKCAFALLALFMVLTPLGLLSAGAAWGEWSAKDFSTSSARAKIQKSAPGGAVPRQAPSGIQSLESVWKAPLANYSPQWFKNQYAGYLFSAATGVFILLFSILGAGALLARRNSG